MTKDAWLQSLHPATGDQCRTQEMWQFLVVRATFDSIGNVSSLAVDLGDSEYIMEVVGIWSGMQGLWSTPEP